MRLLIDMNLSPDWVQHLEARGFDVVHWFSVGDPRAPDRDLLQWARTEDRIVFTNDLDFSALLAHLAIDGPSVFQLRTQDLLPESLSDRVVAALEKHESLLKAGAIVTIDDLNVRVRVLPIGRG